MRRNGISHVVFDIDGTLLNTEAAVHAALRDATERHGLPEIPADIIRKYCGLPGLTFLRTIRIPDAEQVYADWCRALEARAPLIRPFPGIEALLRALRDGGVHLGVVTSRTAEMARTDMEKLGLLGYFPQMITSSDTPLHKPDPAPLLLYLERTAAAREDCLYIGDTDIDRDCARGAGIQFLLAGWGAYTREGLESEPILERPEELLRFVGQAAGSGPDGDSEHK